MRTEVATTVVAATGKYASFVGAPGLITTWHVSNKPNAPAQFSGTLNA
jgi:hypothetical protein